jgi:hypothetical protein
MNTLLPKQRPWLASRRHKISLWGGGSKLEYLGRFFITTTVSVLVPFIAAYATGGKITTIEKMFLGLLLFIIATLLQLNSQVASVISLREPELALWDVRSETDASLSNIRKSFADIVRRRNSLYTLYFQQRISQLEQVLFEASAKEELLVDQDSDTTDFMLRDFAGEESHRICFVHYFKDNDFLVLRRNLVAPPILLRFCKDRFPEPRTAVTPASA